MSRATAFRAAPTAASGRIAGLSDMREVCSAWNTGPSVAILAERNKPTRGLPIRGAACYIPAARGIGPALSLHAGFSPRTARVPDHGPERLPAPEKDWIIAGWSSPVARQAHNRREAR